MKEAVAGELAAAYHSALVDDVRAADYRHESGRLLIHLAREFGFCYGVDRAVDYAYQARRRFPDRNVFLTGEIDGEIDGQHYTFRPGDVAFAGVGSVHGFYNTGTERVRWIETQAPQPPARHAYRWVDQWRRFEEG